MTGKLKYLVILLLFLFSLTSNSQKIENVDFIVRGNNLIVTYDMTNCAPKELYDIKLTAVCDGREVEAASIAGDHHKVSCGKNKKIEWNVLNDNIELKGNVQVKVSIAKTHSTKITGGPSNAFLSMILPGVGDYYVNKDSKKWYYISATYLGLVYFAWSSKVNSNEYYDQYHKATTQPEMDAAYKTANDSYQTFQFLLGAAAAVWVADVVYVTVKGFKNRKEQLNSMARRDTGPRLYFAGTSNSFRIGLIKKF